MARDRVGLPRRLSVEVCQDLGPVRMRASKRNNNVLQHSRTEFHRQPCRLQTILNQPSPLGQRLVLIIPFFSRIARIDVFPIRVARIAVEWERCYRASVESNVRCLLLSVYSTWEPVLGRLTSTAGCAFNIDGIHQHALQNATSLKARRAELLPRPSTSIYASDS